MSGKYIDNTGVTYLWSKIKNEDYKSEYNLGYYDTITANSDGTYTITRQTGYYVFSGTESWTLYGDSFWFVEKIRGLNSNALLLCSNGINAVCYNDNQIRVYLDKNPSITTSTDMNSVFSNGVALQYKLTTATTEKVEKNHYATYNQRFILEHNKSEAERSANLFDDNGTNSIQYIGHYFTNSSYNLTPQNDYNCFRIRVEQNKTYYIKQIGELILRYEDINNNVLGGNANFYQSGYGSFTTPSGCEYVVFSKAISYTNNVMLNEGSIALPYQPYEGKVVHEKELESAKNEINNSIATKQDKLVSNSNIKTINGNSILGSGDLTVTADSVFTEVTDVIDSFIINKNGTWLITCLGYNKIYASDNSTISFYGSALVSMTSVGSDPHICINGTAYACSSAITFVTSGIMQVYKKAN